MKIDKNIFDSLKNISTFCIARGLPAIINFFAITFYAHKLLPVEYGEYSLSLLWATFLATFIFSWLNMALLRFYEENKHQQEVFLYTIRQAFFILSFLFIILSLPLYFIIHRLLFFIIVLTIGQSFFQLCLQLVVSQVKPRSYAILSTLNSAVCLLCAYILLTYAHMGAIGVIISMAFANIVIVAKLYFDNWHFKQKYHFDLKLLIKSFLYGYPLSVSILIGIVLYGLNRVMLNFFCGKTSVGLFSLPYDIANQSVTLIFMSFQLYLYPLVLKILHADGEEMARQRLAENGRIFLVLIIPCLLILMFFPAQIAEVIARVQYRQAFTEILPIISVGAVLQGFKVFYYDLSFQISHKTLIQLYINGVIIGINFLLNLYFIPKFNYLGAAYVSVFTSLVGIILSYSFGKKYFHVPSLLSYKNLKFFAYAIVAGFSMYYIKNISNLFLMIGLTLITVLIYFFLIMLPWLGPWKSLRLNFKWSK